MIENRVILSYPSRAEWVTQSIEKKEAHICAYTFMQNYNTTRSCTCQDPGLQILFSVTFDDADDGFDGALAQSIDGFAHRRAQPVGHLDLGVDICRRGFRFAGKTRLPALMMRFATRGNVRLDLPALQGGDVRWVAPNELPAGSAESPRNASPGTS
jgi:hypothetical protein